MIDSCNKIKQNYYCKTNYVEASKCLSEIIFEHKNNNSKYHLVTEGFIITKIKLNSYKLENFVVNTKEIIFEKIYFKINNEQLSNLSVELKQIDKRQIKINKVPFLNKFYVQNSNHILINTLLTIALIIFFVYSSLKTK